MTSFICDQLIDFDASVAYESQNVEGLINQIQDAVAENGGRKVVILLRSGHYLTTKAFATLYDYIRTQSTNNIVFVLVSTDKSKIFPPLLSLLQSEQVDFNAA